MTMRIGTAHFVTFLDAQKYYEPYNPGMNRYDLAAMIHRKIREGEIHFGPPEVKPGERVSVIPGEGRYQIETE
jgi:hypothetical protein